MNTPLSPAFALMLAACTGAPSPTTPKDTSTDSPTTETDGNSSTGDEGDTDADADADSDVDTDTDTDTDADLIGDAGLVVPPGMDGWVVLYAERASDGSAWVERFAVSSHFFPTGAFVGTTGQLFAETRDPLDGPDDCGTWYLSGSGLTSTLSPYEPLDPGTVTLTLPDTTEVELGPTPYGWQELDLAGAGIEPAYGERYALAASGSETAAFDDLSLPLPERLEVTTPALDPAGTVVPAGDLTLEWTGAHGAELVIEAWADDPSGAYWHLRCALTDDGSFTVPAANLDPLPAGVELDWWLRREAAAIVVLPDGRQIATVPYASLRFSTTRL